MYIPFRRVRILIFQVPRFSELPQETELDNAALSVTGTSVLIYEKYWNLSMIMDYPFPRKYLVHYKCYLDWKEWELVHTKECTQLLVKWVNGSYHGISCSSSTMKAHPWLGQ